MLGSVAVICGFRVTIDLKTLNATYICVVAKDVEKFTVFG